MPQDLPLIDVLVDAREEWGDTRSFQLRCPVCGSNYQHTRQAERIRAEQTYGAKWGGKGDLLIIPIEGECLHVWEICFGFHKGETVCFVRTTDCVVDEEDRQPE